MKGLWKWMMGHGNEGKRSLSSAVTTIKLPEPWYQQYGPTIIATLLALFLGIIPSIVSFVNGFPRGTDLETFHATVLETHRENPHLLVEFEDGSQEKMEFPVEKSLSGMGFYGARFSGWTDEERIHLRGCRVEITGVYLHWTFLNHFRVWELDCPSKNIRIDFATTKYYFRYHRKTEWIFAFGANLILWICAYGAYLNDKERV
ncbi:MAG: hypothetical protein ACKVN9_02355 [Methylophilaceae bacterium]